LSSSQAAVAAAAAAMGMGMDLRMSGGGGVVGGGRNSSDLPYDESRPNDNAISSSTTQGHNSISNNNNNNLSNINNNNHPHQHGLHHPGLHHNQPSASVLNDFAENTMKELLSLYGIAENFRQGKDGDNLMNLFNEQEYF
jgi:hypothetical protein